MNHNKILTNASSEVERVEAFISFSLLAIGVEITNEARHLFGNHPRRSESCASFKCAACVSVCVPIYSSIDCVLIFAILKSDALAQDFVSFADQFFGERLVSVEGCVGNVFECLSMLGHFTSGANNLFEIGGFDSTLDEKFKLSLVFGASEVNIGGVNLFPCENLTA